MRRPAIAFVDVAFVLSAVMALAACGGGDDDHRAAVVQSGTHEARDRVAQKLLGLVELDDVLVRSAADLAYRDRRCRSGSV